MSHSTISLGLGLGGGKSATSSGAPGGGGAFANALSCSFDGSGDYLDLTSSQAFTGAFSASMWFKQTVDALGILFFGDPAGYVEVSGSSAEKVLVRNWGTITSSTGVYDFGAWSHFMFVRDSGNDCEAWVNGASIGTSSKSGTLEVTRLGIYATSVQPFGGHMDEVAIWGSDQSANVSTIYNSGVPADLSALSPLGWWRMGDTDPASADTPVSSVTDVAGSNNLTQATASKQPVISTDVPS